MTRVVVTGLGVVASNGFGVKRFEQALRDGESGVSYRPEMHELQFASQVAGVPPVTEAEVQEVLSENDRSGLSGHSLYGCLAGIECWRNGGFQVPDPRSKGVDWDTAVLMGTGIGGAEVIADWLGPQVQARRGRRLGATVVERVMGSSTSAHLSGILALGGQASGLSSACSTGTEAILNGCWMIRHGRAKRVLAGGAEASSVYVWALFDAMRVLSAGFNSHPEAASRPMSATASGFVPAGGAGALLLESMESALDRGATIYAEVLGGAVNCGGLRSGGSMTAANPEGVQRSIRGALRDARIEAQQLDLINGHLTGTKADSSELANWREALEPESGSFPLVEATKSLTGHALGAAGAIESVACVLQLAGGWVHGSRNCEDLHPGLDWCGDRIVRQTVERDLNLIAKASFGFGDVNACVIFKRWKGETT